MLTRLLIAFKHRFKRLWRVVEWGNGKLFALRYRGLAATASEQLALVCMEGYRFSVVSADDLPALSAFLRQQPWDNVKYFDAHSFHLDDLKRLHNSGAFLMMKITLAGTEQIVGYFFLRGFFIGRAFAGLIVDMAHQNRGLGTMIWAQCMAICQAAGLHLFATISESNIPSVRSCRKGTDVRVAQRLDGDFVLVECRSRQNNQNNQ